MNPEKFHEFGEIDFFQVEDCQPTKNLLGSLAHPFGGSLAHLFFWITTHPFNGSLAHLFHFIFFMALLKEIL